MPRNERDVYYVAFYKHDEPQHLEAGPFVDNEEANDKCLELNSTSRGFHVVVRQVITIGMPD